MQSRTHFQRERVSSVTWEDLQCGEAINVYGRHLLLMACDSSTKEWYARRGIRQRTLTVSHGDVEVKIYIYIQSSGEDMKTLSKYHLQTVARST